jgi:hypothetical protein
MDPFVTLRNPLVHHISITSRCSSSTTCREVNDLLRDAIANLITCFSGSENTQLLGSGHYLWPGWGPKRKYFKPHKKLPNPFQSRTFFHPTFEWQEKNYPTLYLLYYTKHYIHALTAIHTLLKMLLL